MTDQHMPFLRAICADPADDSPRLILADWLDEHGEPERAEFIRIGVELAIITKESPMGSSFAYKDIDRVEQLRRRERELRRAFDPHGKALPIPYCGDDFDGTGSWQWTRGFISRIRLTLSDLLAHGPAICATQPVERIEVSDKRPWDCTSGDWEFAWPIFWLVARASRTS